MRRMLDKKELEGLGGGGGGGGGEGEELYCHCIILANSIRTNYFNHSKTPFDYNSFLQAITDNQKRLACSGIIVVDNKNWFPAISRYENNNSFLVDYIDTTNLTFKNMKIGPENRFSDNVLKVI